MLLIEFDFVFFRKSLVDMFKTWKYHLSIQTNKHQRRESIFENKIVDLFHLFESEYRIISLTC